MHRLRSESSVFAGLTDVLDGWAARKLGQATPVGALVDGISDKVFAASVLGTLVATGMLSPLGALLLATRELGELPLAVRVLTSKRARLTEIDRRANRLGKVATVLEFATVLAVIVHVPAQERAPRRHCRVRRSGSGRLLAARRSAPRARSRRRRRRARRHPSPRRFDLRRTTRS